LASKDYMLRCNVGGASFQLLDYGFVEEPYMIDGERLGTKVKLRGKAEVTGTNAADLASNVEFAARAFRGSVLAFEIYAFETLEYSMLEVDSIDGGPFVEHFEVLEQLDGEPLVKQITFKINNTRTVDGGGGGGGGSSGEPRRVTTTKRPDALREITYIGKIARLDAEAWWTNTRLPALLQPFNANKWIPDVEAVYVGKKQIEYRVTFTELATEIPAEYLATAVDFEHTFSRDRNAQHRQTDTLAYNVLLKPGADVVAMRDLLRPKPPIVVLSERFSYTNYHELRLQVEFVVLRSGSGNDLLEWEQTLENEVESIPVRAIPFSGLRPVILTDPFPVYTATIRGRAVGLSRYPKAPLTSAVFPTASLGATPKVKYRAINAVELETEWTYTYTFATSQQVQPATILLLGRPAAPEFVTGAPTQT
jgi:hypothetical protein